MHVTCPVSQIELPGVPDIKLEGLIVVVGPNSSGKTQLLHDINDVVCGKSRKFIVLTSITYAHPISFDRYITFFLSNGAVAEVDTGQYQKRSLQYGIDEGSGSFQKSVASSQYGQFVAAPKKHLGSVPGFPILQTLGGLTCSALFLKNRLTLMDPCPSFNHTVDAPKTTLQALYLNALAKETLSKETTKVFQRAVWVDSTRITQLVYRAADSTILPSAEDRLEPVVMEKYRTIQTEGDGIRSYSAICATLLLEERPLCLIDEPEMCLHPPQAHAMGRFIGEHTTPKTCTVVATHSSHVLRGILETCPKAHVIRLSKSESKFHARNLGADILDHAISKPRSRSEAILDGLLADGVVLCEAEGDRLVYESTYRSLADKPIDIRFTASEGTGGFADPLRLYRILGVPCAVIADIDFLFKEAELRKVLAELGVPDPDLQGAVSRARTITTKVKAVISAIDPKEVQSELQDLAKDPIELSAGGDTKLRGRLLHLANRLYRLKELKEKGVSCINDSVVEGGKTVGLRAQAESLISDLGNLGLFVVPVGELESWLPVLMNGQNREDKSRWAILAAEKIEDVGEREDDIWRFAKQIRGYLIGR